MNTTMFIMLLLFATGVVWHSYEVWSNPNAFLKRMKHIRSNVYKYGFGIFMSKSIKENFDNNPDFEILLARIGFPVLYGFIIYGLYIPITGHR